MSSVPFTRTLPYVLRDALGDSGIGIVVGTVTGLPDQRHVSVSVAGGTPVAVARLAQYIPTIGEPCYMLTSTSGMLAIGTVRDGGPVGELAYAEVQNDVNVTGLVPASATPVVSAPALTFDGATPIVVEFSAAAVRTPATAGRTVTVGLFDGATMLCRMAVADAAAPAAAIIMPVGGHRRLIPTAGAHTYNIRAYVDAGNGTIRAGTGVGGSDTPAAIRITRA
ncbi:MAG TPA: hypothetical protein VKB57_23635 [Acidimicrobiales bacterium]|nr:hypothetical protein [Acidimicrobiales bacterium]